VFKQLGISRVVLCSVGLVSYQGDENEMDGACSTNGGEEERV
jgi:hypothetical protein